MMKWIEEKLTQVGFWMVVGMGNKAIQLVLAADSNLCCTKFFGSSSS